MSDSLAKHVIPVNIEDEMKKSYIDYAMSVIVARALPDVKDGLKPVHRRILYAMHELGMTTDKPYKKSARVVGEVLGKYHPHADTSVYEAMVRLAQDFASRYPLVDGHGNFGSVDGDSPAAMRYTEVRMSPLASVMLEDIRKETVDFAPNFDESLKEPQVLPSRFPNLLANGSSGIAVGMATNIPPHNLTELIDAIFELVKNPDIVDEDLHSIVKGPDFPTGGQILGREGIHQAYNTGRGIIRVRGVATIEQTSNGKPYILITELPYQVSKSRLVEKVADLVRERKIDGITDLRDESDRKGMRIVIELRRDANPQVILNRLYKFTSLEQTFGINMLALVAGEPKTLSLRQMLLHYIEHQRDIVTRRTRYDLNKAEERAHIIKGLLIALDHIDEVIACIRSSPTVDEAQKRLTAQFSLTDRQARAILEMRLQRLAAMERQKIEDERVELAKAIETYREILSNRQALDALITKELQAIKDKFGDERRTELLSSADEVDIEDLIAEEDVIVTLTTGGYIKRQSLSTFRRQLRGGKGVHAATPREGDAVRHLVTTTTHSYILFLTTSGRVYRIKAHQVPEFGRQARGLSVMNLIQLSPDEKITTVLSVPPTMESEGKHLALLTKRGYIKKTPFSSFENINRAGLIAVSLNDDDEVIAGCITDGSADLMVLTRHGRGIRFNESEVRSMGRTARGVRAIKLIDDDEALTLVTVCNERHLMLVTERGYGKRSAFRLFRRMHRAGQGVIASRIDHRTGKLAVATAVCSPGIDVVILSALGVVIRIKASQVNRLGRATRGITLMRLKEDDAVVAGVPVHESD